MATTSLFQGASLTRLVQGAVVGAVATAAIGFGWGGWMLGSSADSMASDSARDAVVTALAPICVQNFMGAADAGANMVTFKETATRQQASFVEKGGWATFAGDESPAAGVARECARELAKVS